MNLSGNVAKSTCVLVLLLFVALNLKGFRYSKDNTGNYNTCILKYNIYEQRPLSVFWIGGLNERRRREPLEGSGAYYVGKILKLRVSEIANDHREIVSHILSQSTN